MYIVDFLIYIGESKVSLVNKFEQMYLKENLLTDTTLKYVLINHSHEVTNVCVVVTTRKTKENE